MKPKTMILMGVAIACGLAASYMTTKLLAERQVDDQPKVEMLVAKKSLSMGEIIKTPDELFELKAFNKGEEPQGGLDKLSDIKPKMMLKRSLRKGDWITLEDFHTDKDSSIYMNLPEGFRAQGVRVNAKTTAGGFASLPLSRVDVICTVRGNGIADTYSTVLLENVLVLAADTQSTRNEHGQAMPASVVTLALKTDDVLRVTAAEASGELSLVLRKMQDNSKSAEGKVTVAQALGRTSSEPVAPREVAPPVIAENVPVKAPKVEPKIEPKPEPKVAVAPPPEPVVPAIKNHALKIVDGDRQQVTMYKLDGEGNVLESDVAPPRPNFNPPPSPPIPPPSVGAQPKTGTPPPGTPAANPQKTPAANAKRPAA